LLDVLKSVGITSSDFLLDAGCGTGQNLVNIREHITNAIFGFDYAIQGAQFCGQRGLETVCVGSINDIPYRSNCFHGVMSIDVLECDAVDEETAVNELVRVLRPGGHLILVVPAYDWLLSEEHHRAVKASRRYSRRRLVSLLSHVEGLELVRVTHVFASLLPMVAAYRMSLKYFHKDKQGSPQSELKPLPRFANELLFRIVDVERRVLTRFDLPFGSTILAVWKKAA
jgi:ubiquinone/menaquinone biosynthesis C-methylase UbiE